MRCMYVSLPWQRVASTMVALKGEGKRDAPRTITACQHASRAEPMQAACIPPWLMPDAELINAHHVRASGMRFASSLCRKSLHTMCHKTYGMMNINMMILFSGSTRGYLLTDLL